MLVRLVCLTSVAALLAVAQFATFPDKGYFREQWQAPPLDIEIESVGRLDDFYFDGKIELSLRSYIELVMANNPDINLQKLAVFEQQNAIQRAFSPFDPTLNLGFTTNRSTTLPNDILEGADVRTNLNQRGNFTYSQTFDTGTNYTVGYVGGKTANNSQFRNFNPSITQSLQFTVSQPLLRDRGRHVQRIPIFVARSRLKLTEEQVRNASSACWCNPRTPIGMSSTSGNRCVSAKTTSSWHGRFWSAPDESWSWARSRLSISTSPNNNSPRPRWA